MINIVKTFAHMYTKLDLDIKVIYGLSRHIIQLCVLNPSEQLHFLHVNSFLNCLANMSIGWKVRI